MLLTNDDGVVLVAHRGAERLVRLLDPDDLDVVGEPRVPRAGRRRGWSRGRTLDARGVPALQALDAGDRRVVGQQQTLHLVAGQQTDELLGRGQSLAGAAGRTGGRGGLRPLLQHLHALQHA